MRATNNCIHSCQAANGITMFRGAVMAGLLMTTFLMALPCTTFALERDGNGRDDNGKHSLVQHPYSDHSLRAIVTQLQTEMAGLKTQMYSTNITALQKALSEVQADVAAIKTRMATAELRLKEVESKPVGIPDLATYLKIDPNSINGVNGPHVIFTGANVHVRSGSGFTDDNISGGGTLKGLGNLIIAYNENSTGQTRTGSHNLVGGSFNIFTSVGGMVFGLHNTLSGEYAAIVSGDSNTASGVNASVLAGNLNTASGLRSTVYGGLNNTAVNMNSYSPIQGGRPTPSGQ
jgi:hypothetical protein